MIVRNPRRINARRRNVKVPKPDHLWLRTPAELVTLLDASAELDAEARDDRQHIARRAIVATLALTGLRIHELCSLRWGDVDLAAGRIEVRRSKTDAGERTVDILGLARHELATWKARAPQTGHDAYVFATRTGSRPSEDNLRDRVVAKVVECASELNAERELPAFPAVSPRDLRRTAISTWLAIGWDVPRVMAAAGHAEPRITLSIYAKVLRLTEDERAELRDLLDGHAAGDVVPELAELAA